MSDDLSQRLAFLGIDDAVKRSLRDVKPFLESILPGVLDGFYSLIDGFPDVARLFHDRESRNRAKAMQLNHWSLIASAKFDEDYIASVRRVGEMHNRLGLEPRWYIGGYSFIINGIHSRISERLKDSPLRNNVSARNAWLTAITKASMLDMDFAISVYLEAGKRDKRETLDKLARSFDAGVRTVIDDLSGSADQMQHSARQLAGISRDSKEKAVVVAAASTQTSKASETVATAAEELTASITEISRRVHASSLVAKDANEMARRVSGTMVALLEQTKAINAVTKFINKVSDQINLLALNATIEAARAGETGKSFAVVATEVKNLAKQTNEAAASISTQLQDILRSSSQADEQIRRIEAIIDEINEYTESVASAVEQQSAATGEIARNVFETSAAAGEVTRSIAVVEQGAEQTNRSSNEVLAAAERLARQATTLRSKVDEFLATIAAT